MFLYISDFIIIYTLAIKGLHLDSLNICKLFLEVKTENGLLGKHKNHGHKTGTNLQHNCTF